MINVYLTFQDDKSNKFWNITTNDTTLITNWGKIGTSGQSQTKYFSDAESCEKEAKKLVAFKIKKGYVEGIVEK